MYFPNAFRKVFVADENGGTLNLASTGSTQNLTPGQIGLFDSKTYAVITAAGAAGTNQKFIIAQGSYRTKDKLGDFHGGYTESTKSKEINPKYVSRFFKVTAQTAVNQILEISDLAITCGHTYDLRIDVKGSPVLRFLAHNLYHTVSAWSGCCADDCTVSCTGDPVDMTVVLLEWKDQINRQPLLSKFLRATVDTVVLETTGNISTSTTGNAHLEIANIPDTSDLEVGDRVRGVGVSGKIVSIDSSSQVTLDTASTATTVGVAVVFSREVDTETYVPVTVSPEDVVSTLRIEVAYVETKFGNCTFDTNDHYDLEPIFTYLSIVDESGDPCAVKNTANSSPFDGVTEVQAPTQAMGTGETAVRDFILAERYLQNPFPNGCTVDSLRMREILDDPTFTALSRTAFYDQICLLHNVPRFNNPTGVFDNDQYLLVIYVPTGTTSTNLTDLIQDILDVAGMGVTMESF
jgi:hypothetical protein